MRRARLAILLIAAVSVGGGVAGCSPAEQSVSGLVIQVNGTSPSAISSFVLRTADGRLITFMVGPVTFDQQSFPPEHLREHQALAAPVIVTYRVENGANVAVKLADAP